MADQVPGILVYTAKFLCGVFDPDRISDQEPEVEGPVKPGRYATAINVHNPHPSRPVFFTKKAVLLFAGSKPTRSEVHEQVQRPILQVPVELGPDFALEIDCPDIRDVLLAGVPPDIDVKAPTFIKGVVVLEVREQMPLDVISVYTAEPIGLEPGRAAGQGLAIEMERVPGTFVPFN